MQFAVPQFTDVEDRIVGGLTFKQFGIVFAAGVIVFAFFSLTKNLVITIILAVLLGLPAIVIAFGKINGRPIYSAFGNFLGYFTGTKVYIFHKQAKSLPQDHMAKAKVTESLPERLGKSAAVVRIKQLNYILQQQATEEKTLISRIVSKREAQT